MYYRTFSNSFGQNLIPSDCVYIFSGFGPIIVCCFLIGLHQHKFFGDIICMNKRILLSALPLLKAVFLSVVAISSVNSEPNILKFTSSKSSTSESSINNRLEKVIVDISSQYPEIKNIGVNEWYQITQDELDDEWLIIDVRTEEEYQQGHLPNAIRISPNIDTKQWQNLLAGYTADTLPRHLLVYCSVGKRSSDFVHRMGERIGEFQTIRNLEGGIFKWHNSGFRVVSAHSASARQAPESSEVNNLEEAGTVHPFNWWWGRLLNKE